MDYLSLVKKYQHRNRSVLTDGITTALSHLDELSVDLGILTETDLITETLETLSLSLPFAVIAVTEQGAVILGRKTQKAAVQDASFRMLKTGAGMAAGAAAMTAGLGAIPAIPVAVGVRILLDRYRSSRLTAYRVKQRVDRLKALNRAREKQATPLSARQVVQA